MVNQYPSTLQTGIQNCKNVGSFIFGQNKIHEIENLLRDRRNIGSGYVVFFIDSIFKTKSEIIKALKVRETDTTFFVDTRHEPYTKQINSIKETLKSQNFDKPSAIVALGGGCTLDTAKAIANLLTNPGKAEDYQGWDLVKNPAVYKIGIPTISGTGAESTRTCVMTNSETGLKLGMNSDYTVFDQLILDPNLTTSVPKNQYFWTGMDAYIHCIESMAGIYRNSIGDAYSSQALKLCREVFFSENMKSPQNREKLMVASYMGGCAIASSFVGLIHPFSAGLSVVLGTHHCIANCIVMNSMDVFYPKECEEFKLMASKQKIKIPTQICADLSLDKLNRLYECTVVHEKPLTNALGENYKKILTKAKVIEFFQNL